MIAICPHCKAQAEVDDSWGGRDVSCPSCQGVYRLPTLAIPPGFPTVSPAAPAAPPGSPGYLPPGVFQCPYCRTTELPQVTTQISVAGWVVFGLMLFFCFPLCFIGLLMTEEKRRCRMCHVQLG
ncbi:MAG: LITAF-like zinc ribbon domain-containing protein [Pirellulales bacterium]